MPGADDIDALLPQTQCTRCGYPGCRPYAEAIARGETGINHCPPGGAATIAALAKLLRREPLPLDPANGAEGPPLLALIDEDACIGCTKCLPPCPVDAIIGARKHLHTVLAALCTGCELCVAPCPVDCITMVARPAAPDAAPAPEPGASRRRFAAHNARIARRAQERAMLLASRKRQASTHRRPEHPQMPVHPATRRTLYRRLQAADPHPRSELEYSSPFELLVAVMLSAHTTDKSVNAATRRLFPLANTPQALLALGVEGVKPYLRPVGLYNAKSQNLIGLCRRLMEHHGGKVPSERDALEALPGVGRKTASIILNIVFGQNEIAVDTHIFRVANRTGLAPGKTPLAVERALVANTPEPFKRDAHHWLLLHGRYVCTARAPACPTCIIADLCEYPHKTRPNTGAQRRPRASSPGTETPAARAGSSGPGPKRRPLKRRSAAG